MKTCEGLHGWRRAANFTDKTDMADIPGMYRVNQYYPCIQCAAKLAFYQHLVIFASPKKI